MQNTLSHSLDPRGPAKIIPGGIAISVDVSIASGTDEPVEILDLMNFTRTDEEDGHELEDFGKGVRVAIEQRLGLALIEQTVTVLFRGPANYLRLPRFPSKVISPASDAFVEVKEVINGVEGADIKASFYIDGDRILKTSSPALLSGRLLKVVYTAGFAEVPADILHEIKRETSTRFDLRESVVTGTIARPIPNTFWEALAHYQR